MRPTQQFALVFLLSVATSCARFVPPERLDSAIDLPATFTLYGPVEDGPEQWWNAFGSEELNRLIDRALLGNLDIMQAAARMRQASALARQTHALRLPTLGYGAEASLSRRRTELGLGENRVDTATRRLNALGALLGASAGNNGTLSSSLQAFEQAESAAETLLASSPPDSVTEDEDRYGAGLTAGYEVDLWGRLRAGEEAAQARLEATREEAHALIHSIAGQVALTWLDLLESGQILEVVRGQLETNRTNLGLIEVRYRNGLATTLDLYQQRQAVAETESVIPLIEARYALQRNTLAVLLGEAPQTDLKLAENTFATPWPRPDYGVPADVLSRRPDVRAAGLRLQAADWEVSAAKADRLPALTLSAGLSTDAVSVGRLLDDWIAQLAASVAGPLFDGGRRQAEVERARAVVDERLAFYKQNVLVAIQEVEDALILEDRQQVFISALEVQLLAAQNALREAGGRYRQGLTDYLPVLTALRNVQGLERDIVEARHDMLVYRVQLHLALGGTWMTNELNKFEDSSS